MSSRASLLLSVILAACQSPKSTAVTSNTAPSAPAGQDLSRNSPAVASTHAELGKPAPDFTLHDLDGRAFALSQQRGKTVVLEWFNPECPFVRRNHTQGPLKDMARKQMANGVVWVSVNSGAAGKEGAGADKSRDGVQRYGMSNPVLLDESGEVGRAFDAKHTPHMYVIDPSGVLVYRGAIDNAQDGDPDNGQPFVNYVEAALGDLAAARPVRIAETQAYGCSVKYGR